MSQAVASTQQAQRMKAAVDGAVALGPGFLRGDVSVDVMTQAMVAAVQGYVADEQTDGRDGAPLGEESAQLFPVLRELMACGGGFRAGRCDADCVARTMTELVAEFGVDEPTHTAV
ncbi:hypothetical protein [Microbacterium terrisoli]|uniref:hypothetical protein n=1 Tax=Microbacterium terrisoli TaxID=3242192 RepID=UPI002803AA98|nr:hypothetical protein [Microbacterium protaetiae]